MADVFVAIKEIVKKHIVKEEPRKLTIENASGRTVVVALSSDPDVSVVEMVGKTEHRKVAIEVKGGTDVSNAHNRAGEAEKSHSKAKQKGYRDFWTIISKKGLSMTKLQGETEEELRDNLLDIYEELTGGAIPNVRRRADLQVA